MNTKKGRAEFNRLVKKAAKEFPEGVSIDNIVADILGDPTKRINLTRLPQSMREAVETALEDLKR